MRLHLQLMGASKDRSGGPCLDLVCLFGRCATIWKIGKVVLNSKGWFIKHDWCWKNTSTAATLRYTRPFLLDTMKRWWLDIGEARFTTPMFGIGQITVLS